MSNPFESPEGQDLLEAVDRMHAGVAGEPTPPLGRLEPGPGFGELRPGPIEYLDAPAPAGAIACPCQCGYSASSADELMRHLIAHGYRVLHVGGQR